MQVHELEAKKLQSFEAVITSDCIYSYLMNQSSTSASAAITTHGL